MASIDASSVLPREVIQLLQRTQQAQRQQLQQQYRHTQEELCQLRDLVDSNNTTISRLGSQLDDMAGRLRALEHKHEGRLLSLAQELSSFRQYYSQCYEYTLRRVNQVASKVEILAEHVRDLPNLSATPTLQYVQYAYELAARVVQNSVVASQTMRQLCSDQLFELEVRLGTCLEQIEGLALSSDQLKEVKFSNEALRDTIRQATREILATSKYIQSDRHNDENILAAQYSPKFKHILKAIEGTKIQIQLIQSRIKAEITHQADQERQKRGRDMGEFQHRLHQLETLLAEDKKLLETKINHKEQLIKKGEARILELQLQLKTLADREIHRQHQMAELKRSNLQCQQQFSLHASNLDKQKPRANKNTHNNIGRPKQSLLLDSPDQQKGEPVLGNSEKLILVQAECQALQSKNACLFRQIQGLKASNKFDSGKGQNLTKSQATLPHQVSFSNSSESGAATNLGKINQISRDMSHNICMHARNEWCNVKQTPRVMKISGVGNSFDSAEWQELLFRNEQLTKANRQLESEILRLLNAKTIQNEQDQLYLDQIEAQLSQKSIAIESLTKQNAKLSRQVVQLVEQNQRLVDQLQLQASELNMELNRYKNIVKQLSAPTHSPRAKSPSNNRRYADASESSGPQHRGSARRDRSRTPGKDARLGPLQPQSAQLPLRKSKTAAGLSSFVLQLQGLIQSMGLRVPISCQVDAHGCVRESETGAYLLDHSSRRLALTEPQLQAAVEAGILLT